MSWRQPAPKAKQSVGGARGRVATHQRAKSMPRKSAYNRKSMVKNAVPRYMEPLNREVDAVKWLNKAFGKDGWAPEFYPTEHYIN